MNRALLTTAAAAAGVTGVLVLAPHVSPVTASASTGTATGSAGSSAGPGSSGASGSTGSSGSSGSAGTKAVSGTVTGNAARQQFGPIQVEITVAQGTVTDIQVIQQPGDGRSRWINSQAIPILVSQALKAQSANIHGVSGATLTTGAFISSLSSALQQAGL